jgi:hypothetical protein
VRPLRPGRPQPFVLLRDNRTVGEFAFIPTNLPEFRDGDVIEVRGNGPFRLPQIKFTDRGLDLRAGEGYQPVFVPADVLPADQAWIIVAKGKLRLKGCEFRRMTYDDAHLIEAAGDSCEIVNCTLARGDSHARVLLDVNSSTVRIEDSLLIVGRGHASLSVGQDVREFTLRNSLFFTSSFDFLACQGGQDAQTVVLENNTFCGNGGVIQHFGSYLLMRDERFEGPPLKVIARRNVFASVCYFNTVFYLKDKVSPEEFRSVIAWEGEGNITPELRFPEATAKLIGPDKLGVAVDPNLRFYLHKAWSMDLPLAERLESIRDAVAGDLPAEGEPIGPDWNLIGPGAGYLATLDPAERDRHAEETHEGGPFTLLHEGAPAHGFITLADAVRAAQDGDVIELRSDDALTAQLDSSVPGKNLTLRAAAGYQPKYVDTTGFRPGPGHAWEIVNLTLHGAFAASGVRRLRNCAFDGAVHPSTHYAPGPLLFATEPDGPDVEVVNCCLPGTVMTESVSERKVVFRNCVLERCVVGDPVNQTNRDGQTIVLERCALWAPSGVTWLIATGNGVGPDGHANVVAERCILDGPLLAIRERRQLRWSGDWNLFRLWSRSWCWETANEYSEVGLSSWRKLWDSDAHSLSSVSIHFDPQQWRILPVDGAELPAAGVDFRLFHRPAAFH